MPILNDISVKQKVTAIIVSTSCIVLFLSLILLAGSQLSHNQRLILQELETIAEIIANNVTAAVVFDDRNTAQETLSALRAKPDIVSAHLQTLSGELFADYTVAAAHGGKPSVQAMSRAKLASFTDDLAPDARGHELRLFAGVVDLYAPILLDGGVIGRILIRSNLDYLFETLKYYAVSSIMIIMIFAIVAFLIASRLQKIISDPVLNLLNTMRQVSSKQDYAVRAEKHGDDELGVLADNFNAMLARIQSRDEDLRATWQRAEAANRAKTEFLANMSHELRTPLNAIIGFSEIAKGEIFGPLGSPRYRDYMEDIHSSGEHLLEVINDILDISKVEAGELDLNEEPVRLADVIADSLRLVTPRAEQAGLALTHTIDPSLPELRADARMVKQGLINLLSNAVKFTPEGGQVRVDARCRPGGPLVVSVADSGIGIAKSDIPRVLSPFGQVEGSLSRNFQGTGLGLSIAKSFVEAHGGKLQIESKPGEGTVVSLCFPPERIVTRGRSGDPVGQAPPAAVAAGHRHALAPAGE